MGSSVCMAMKSSSLKRGGGRRKHTSVWCTLKYKQQYGQWCFYLQRSTRVWAVKHFRAGCEPRTTVVRKRHCFNTARSCFCRFSSSRSFPPPSCLSIMSGPVESREHIAANRLNKRKATALQWVWILPGACKQITDRVGLCWL